MVCGGLGAQPPEKITLFIPRNGKFCDYSVFKVNKMPSIKVEWNEDNIFMLLKIPLYEGGGLLYTFFKSPKNPLFEVGIIKQKVLVHFSNF